MFSFKIAFISSSERETSLFAFIHAKLSATVASLLQILMNYFANFTITKAEV
ncbi:hypothetical protein LBJG_00429 [Lactobacillus jensenii 1153]|nr:hypothetical protein LBJG_00429 [Lactobacillus jensenii 1153]